MLRTSSLFMASLLLAACESEPAPPPAAPAAPAGAERPFTPPANAKVLQLGEPRQVPAELQGKAHAPEQPDLRVTCRSSREGLTRRFGPDQLVDREVGLSEGETAPGTVVAEGTPFAQEVVWADAKRSQPERIRVLGPGIRDPQGLGLGSTLAELEAALGPFQLTGFEWDYAGTVMLKDTRLEKLEGRLFFRLDPGIVEGAEAQAALQATMGDRLFASSDPNVKILAPVVGEFLLVCPQGPAPTAPSAPAAPSPQTAG